MKFKVVKTIFKNIVKVASKPEIVVAFNVIGFALQAANVVNEYMSSNKRVGFHVKD